MIGIGYHTGVTLTEDIPRDAFTWRNMALVFKWCRQYTLVDEISHRRWLEAITTDPKIKMYGITADKEVVGVCGLTSIDRVNQNAEFSLYIAPNWQRRGYGKKALYTLVKHGFEDHNLHRIWGETFDGNPAAGMFEGLGFTKEGTLRESYFRSGRFIDSHIYAILREKSCLRALSS